MVITGCTPTLKCFSIWRGAAVELAASRSPVPKVIAVFDAQDSNGMETRIIGGSPHARSSARANPLSADTPRKDNPGKVRLPDRPAHFSRILQYSCQRFQGSA